MAVGGPQQSLSIPSLSELAGGTVTPAVTPNSVAVMSDALRQGFITADDIIQRTGKRAQLKEKADVMALTEQMSPEAVEARQASLVESLNRSRLGAAQAGAALPLVEPTGQLAQSQLESQIAYQKYPAAKLFDQYAPVLGIAEPKNSAGQTDWSQKASIGVQIGEHLRLKQEADEKLKNIRSEKSPTGSVISSWTLQGLPVDPKAVEALERQARSPFKLVTPGTVQISAIPAAPVVESIGASPETAGKWRAQLINEGISNAAQMSDEEVGQLIQSRRQASVSVQPVSSVSKPIVEPSIGQSVPGGFFLGPEKSRDKPEKPVPGEGVEKLALAGQAIRTAGKLDETYKRLIENSPIFTGLVAGTLTKAAAGKRWNEDVAAFEREATAILAPVAKGTYNETGVLSDVDVERYKNVLPDLRDSPKIGAEKIRRLLEEATTAYNSKLDVWRQAGYDVSGFENVQTPAGSSTSPTAAQGPVVEIQGVGRVYRGSDGKFYRQ